VAVEGERTTPRATFRRDQLSLQSNEIFGRTNPIPKRSRRRANCAQAFAPVETVANVELSKGQSTIAASSLFTASDPDGDTITKYAFWNTGAGGGHFMLNGVAQGSGQEIDVSAAQLSQLSYQSGSGADTLWVRANDGYAWGTWSQSFGVSPWSDTPPTVTGSNVTAARGQSFAASSLFTATDADGDAITKYAFWIPAMAVATSSSTGWRRVWARRSMSLRRSSRS
jgi:hypothetical protein